MYYPMNTYRPQQNYVNPVIQQQIPYYFSPTVPTFTQQITRNEKNEKEIPKNM